MSFGRIFEGRENRVEIVGLFLALLELSDELEPGRVMLELQPEGLGAGASESILTGLSFCSTSGAPPAIQLHKT
jgi:hypothetical protein